MLSRFLILSFVALIITGCDDAISVGVSTNACPVVQYSTVLEEQIDEIQVWVGNRAGFQASPLLSVTHKTKIDRVIAFFQKRTDGWFIAAGADYNPASRAPTSEFTVKFLRNDKVATYIGWGYNYMETPGCGFEASRVLPVPDRPALLSAVFGGETQ